MVTGNYPETPVSVATTSGSHETLGPHVQFNPIVTTASGSTTQLNQDHEPDPDDPFMNSEGSNTNTFGQRPLFSRVHCRSLCNQKLLNNYFNINRIFPYTLLWMMKTLSLIHPLPYQMMKILELLECHLLLHLAIGSSNSSRQLELDKQAVEGAIWLLMLHHFLRLIMIKSNVNSAYKLLIFLAILIN